MIKSSPMSETSSQGLIKAYTDGAIQSAILFWAEGSTGAETFDRASKLRDKTQVVRGFFDFVRKHPGETKPEDVRRWREHLETRGQKPATVYARVSRVSAFFKWLMADPLLGQHIRSNPAAQARPRHPQPYQSESVKALTDDEMNRLLAAVKAQADSGSVVGKRDYALLLFFFLTGLRRN
jgi:integrase